MARLKIEKTLDLIADTKTYGIKRLKQLYAEIEANQSNEDKVQGLLKEVLEIKSAHQDKLDKSAALRAKKKSVLAMVNMSGHLQALIESGAKKSKKSFNEYLWDVLAKHFDIPVEECDPAHWAKVIKE